MSYDVHLIMKAGDYEFKVDGTDLNYTSNVGPMFRAAGLDIRKLNGLLAKDASKKLYATIVEMNAHPDRYKRMSPPNGWGDFTGALHFLRRAYEHCVEHPLSTFTVSY